MNMPVRERLEMPVPLDGFTAQFVIPRNITRAEVERIAAVLRTLVAPGGEEAINERERCAANDWTVGTRLVGDEGYRPTTIEITAIGEDHVLARVVDEDGELGCESPWRLDGRNWKAVR